MTAFISTLFKNFNGQMALGNVYGKKVEDIIDNPYYGGSLALHLIIGVGGKFLGNKEGIFLKDLSNGFFTLGVDASYSWLKVHRLDEILKNTEKKETFLTKVIDYIFDAKEKK